MGKPIIDHYRNMVRMHNALWRNTKVASFCQLTFALSTGRHSDPSKQLITLSKLSPGIVPFALTENALIWRPRWRRYVKVGDDGRCKWRDQIALPLICHREKRTPFFESVALAIFFLGSRLSTKRYVGFESTVKRSVGINTLWNRLLSVCLWIPWHFRVQNVHKI